MSAPLCKCHGEPMWANNSVGGWRCRVKAKARQNPKNRAYYHRADGGYTRRRQRMLADQRNRIVDQLDQLSKEAATC